MTHVADEDFILAWTLGLDIEAVKEARPLIHEMGFRFGEVLKDLRAEHDPSTEAMAVAQAATTSIILDVAIEMLEEDSSLFFRLLSAASNGLFDIDKPNPRLSALYFDPTTGDD